MLNIILIINKKKKKNKKIKIIIIIKKNNKDFWIDPTHILILPLFCLNLYGVLSPYPGFSL